jgi:hypothetical protein
MPRLNAKVNNIIIDSERENFEATYNVGDKIPKKVADKFRGRSLTTAYGKRGETVIAKCKINDITGNYLGILEASPHSPQKTNKRLVAFWVKNDEISINCELKNIFKIKRGSNLKDKPLDDVNLEKRKSHQKRRSLDEVNLEFTKEKAESIKKTSTQLQWQAQSHIRIDNGEKPIDKTLPRDKSIRNFIVEHNANAQEDWRYINIKINHFSEAIQPAAYSMAEVSDQDLLEEYKLQLKEIVNIDATKFNEDELEMYDILLESLKAFEREIEKRGLD